VERLIKSVNFLEEKNGKNVKSDLRFRGFRDYKWNAEETVLVGCLKDLEERRLPPPRPPNNR
jgi:hypothetical protein